MGDTSIRLSDEAKRRLELEKREGESFEDAILRLTSTDKWNGFGALADEEETTREGMQEMRRRTRSGFDDDVEGSEDG